MYFADLSPYSYLAKQGLNDVLNVGWLDHEYLFETGHVSEEIRAELGRALIRAKANQMRGFHICEFCIPNVNITHINGQDIRIPIAPRIDIDGDLIALGSAEIWIPSRDGNIVYAAPTLIYHYVLEHDYLPPQEFLEAVIAFKERLGWDAKHEADKRIYSTDK